MSRPVPLLAALALTWVVALGATEWLGLTALGSPRTEETPLRLMLRAADAETRAITLESALVSADMATDGARWTLERPESGKVRDAVELRPEDARKLDLLPAGFEVFRLGGEPALRLAMPDRGPSPINSSDRSLKLAWTKPSPSWGQICANGAHAGMGRPWSCGGCSQRIRAVKVHRTYRCPS